MFFVYLSRIYTKYQLRFPKFEIIDVNRVQEAKYLNVNFANRKNEKGKNEKY